MFCDQCGTSNPDNAAICVVCGGQLEKGTNPPPVLPIGEVPVSVGTHSPAGEYVPTEYVPTEQEMPPPVSLPMSQQDQPFHDVAQAVNGIPQSYLPPTNPPGDQLRSAEMFGSSQPAHAGQPSSSIEHDQTLPQMPPLQPDQPPYDYDHSGGPSTPPPVVREPWYRALPKPMPIWALVGCIVAVIVLLVVLQLTGSDWAAGAMHVGIVAGIVALLVALVAGVRILLGMAAKSNPKRVIQLVSACLAILLLLSLCLVGLTQQSTIHGLQAHSWEGQWQWQSSINEYQLAGEGTPTSENIARVYNEWGEQFSAQQHYVDAFAKFDIVKNNYGSASTGVARAQSDTIKAYLGWGQQASQQHDYTAATSHYDALLQLSYCTATCQSQANALDATAYYNLAESKLATQNYPDAVTNFVIVVSRFASSPEAQKLHEDYAKALLGQGKQQITTESCTSAIPIYKQLSSQFGDTPEGQQATSALKAPQPVKGHFITTVPNNPALTPVAALMQGYYDTMSNVQFYALLGVSPTATIQRNGSFSFKPVKQGTYDLVWGTNNSDGNQLYYSIFHSVSLAFVVKVGPLCPYDFGEVNEPIPQAS